MEPPLGFHDDGKECCGLILTFASGGCGRLLERDALEEGGEVVHDLGEAAVLSILIMVAYISASVIRPRWLLMLTSRPIVA